MSSEPNNDGEALKGLSLAEDGTLDLCHLPVEDQVAALQDRLHETRTEANQSREAAERTQAELVNFRRRTEEERIESSKYANARLITKLLPVMEELELALAHTETGNTNDSWWEGVRLIQRKLASVFLSERVTEIETIGTEFDPTEHEALGTIETAEHPPGYVAEVVRPGYRLHDRVIQPAQVMVARELTKSDQTEDFSGSKEN